MIYPAQILAHLVKLSKLVVYPSLIWMVKSALIYIILIALHQGLEDDRHGSINQRSLPIQLIMTSLFLVLSGLGLYGVYSTHLGLFLVWFLLRPLVYILDLESALWSSLALSLIVGGCFACFVTYEPLLWLSTLIHSS